MKIYIAGPMSGIKDMNFPAFHAAAEALRALGHEVVNPAELNPDPGKPWAECMKVDIAQLVTCDAVALLPNWSGSKGAEIELNLAIDLDLDIFSLPELLAEAMPA